MRVEFSIKASSAIARGLRQPFQWQAWVAKPQALDGELEMDLSHVPAMARRRLGPLAKMAVVVADDVLAQAHQCDLPVVWVSRYGDSEKSLQLLRAHVGGEPLSPTAFALSVHNGIGAQYSILRSMVSNAVCVASSAAAPEAGIVEAIGLLQEGAPEVMLVCYDECLPGEYAQFDDASAADFAWAVLISARPAMSPGFALLRGTPPVAAVQGDGMLPHALQVLRFLLDPAQAGLSHAAGAGCAWTWERVHG